MASWSGAILSPNVARSASRLAVGSAFSRSHLLMKKHAACPVDRPSATACSSPASMPPDASTTKIAPSTAAKPSIDLGHEVRVTGRVDERDARPVVLERPDREAQRLASLLLLGLEVEVGASHRRPSPGAGSPRP